MNCKEIEDALHNKLGFSDKITHWKNLSHITYNLIGFPTIGRHIYGVNIKVIKETPKNSFFPIPQEGMPIKELLIEMLYLNAESPIDPNFPWRNQPSVGFNKSWETIDLMSIEVCHNLEGKIYRFDFLNVLTSCFNLGYVEYDKYGGFECFGKTEFYVRGKDEIFLKERI